MLGRAYARSSLNGALRNVSAICSFPRRPMSGSMLVSSSTRLLNINRRKSCPGMRCSNS
ncbi:hypothetical protein DP23_4385 [Ralstonia pickettii]|nr:hypothetical protein DP23_4385 [Ralstonia pickettii]